MPQVIDHEEDNLSDKETYSKNIPAIGKNLLISIVFADTDTGEWSVQIMFDYHDEVNIK